MLANRVEAGLRLLMKTGAFDRRYQAFKKEILSGLELSGRRLLLINNPLLTPETSLSQRALWDNLAQELKAPGAAP